MVVRNLGGMFAGTNERLGSWWSGALSAVLLAAPLRAHHVSFGILGVSFLALCTFPLLRAVRRPSLTTGVA